MLPLINPEYEQLLAKPREYPFITDVDKWLKKKSLPMNSKVFIIKGGYPDLKKALVKREWIENPHSNSSCFHLKWTLKAKDIDNDSLKEYQIVNHFSNNAAITTKAGLARSLRNLVWFNNVDVDTFYPVCFDFAETDEFENFIQEFKAQKAEGVIKEFIQREDKFLTEEKEAQLSVAIEICSRRVLELDELVDSKNVWKLVTDKEWEILADDEPSKLELAVKKHKTFLESLKPPKKAKRRRKKESKELELIQSNPLESQDNRNEILSSESENEEEEKIGNSKNKPEISLESKARNILTLLKSKFPQFCLNGCQNIWIVKPAGLSRGRGITCLRSLAEITDLLKGKENQYVIQKYIENPLIVKGRKFDIRQWVLVTSFNPLTVWFYDECYIRFSAEKYDCNDLSNKFIHLTNNSIAKYSKQFDNSEIDGCMWTCHELADHIEAGIGKNVFEERIRPRLKEIVIYSLQSVQDSVENRKNSVELFGYDFMLDDEFNSWLIEINSSPAMDYSSAVTENMVQKVMEDCVKVIVDYGMSNSKKRREIDTGLFKRIFKGENVVEKPSTVGLNLLCEGVKITKKKGSTSKRL